MSKSLGWNERLALIAAFSPTDAQICTTFDLTQDELDTARTCAAQGAFSASPESQFDTGKYGNPFVAAPAEEMTPAPTMTVTAKSSRARKSVSKAAAKSVAPAAAVAGEHPASGKVGATTHSKPESATKKSATTNATPLKRGRKGDKISNALQAVPDKPVSVEAFLKTHGVSLAVLRQSRRFIDKLPADVQKKIGRVCVRQDANKQLMIWREANIPAPVVAESAPTSASPVASEQSVATTA